MVQFFIRPVGWILALVLLNVVPMVALWASRQNPSLGIVALAADGFISGIALGPLLAIANYLAPNSIPGALAVTGGVFVAVTGYVMFSKEKFSAPAGLLTGMFFALVIAMIVNSFIQMSGLGLIITIGIGIFGVVSLVYATSDVLNNPEYDNPVQEMCIRDRLRLVSMAKGSLSSRMRSKTSPSAPLPVPKTSAS